MKLKLNDYITYNVNISILVLLKNVLLRKKIASMTNRWNINSLTWIYANISWLWKTHHDDWIIISDNNIDTAIDIWSTLALSAISMWIWMLVARWALAWVTYLANTTKLTSWINRISKIKNLSKVWTIWKFYLNCMNYMNLILWWYYYY